MTHRVAVVGSRDYETRWVVRDEVQRVGMRHAWDIELVSGGARGVDSLAESIASEFGVPIRVHPADWKREGRSAGYKRNKLIVNDADEMLAFFGPVATKGTQHSIDLARAKGIPVRVFFDGRETAA